MAPPEHIEAKELVTPTQAELHRLHKERQQRIALAGYQKAAAQPPPAKPPPKASIPHDVFPAEAIPAPAHVIIDYVCQYYGVDRGQVISANRSKFIAEVRSVSIYLVRRLLGMSVTTIGNIFGGRDHTTVLHSINKIARHCMADSGYRRVIDGLRDRAQALLWASPVKWGRYVPYWRIPDYERLGWLTQALYVPHSRYSVLMVWLCQCPMVEPK